MAQSYLTLVTPWTVTCQALLSMGFPRQGCWSGLPFPSSRDLSDPGIELRSPVLQADPLLTEPPGLYLQHNYDSEDKCTSVFTAALVRIAKTWEPSKCPWKDKWIKKMQCIYTMQYYSAIRKNEIMPFAATWMDLEIPY